MKTKLNYFELSKTLNKNLVQSLLSMPRVFKRVLALVVDAGVCLLTVWLAFYLRFGFYASISGVILWSAVVSMVISMPVFIATGLYRAIFRYSGLAAMLAILRAMFIYTLIFSGVFTFYGIDGVPRTIGFIQPVLLLVSITANRLVARIWLGGNYFKSLHADSIPQALVYGAGNAGRQLAAAMLHSHEVTVAGFLDDDADLHGQVLNGLVIYSPADLTYLINELSITDVLLAMPSISGQRRSKILSELKTHGIAVRTIPSLSEVASGKIKFNEIRELDIDDLLGRDPVIPNPRLFAKNNESKVVMVTGAGGSIGSELCRQILRASPDKLLLVELSEAALYSIEAELRDWLLMHLDMNRKNKTEIVPLLGDVKQAQRMSEIIRAWRPETIYHAAAYKHVPIVEFNVAEGIRNNLWGTLVLAEQAFAHGVSDFVLISTDKAVRPTNVMGVSKRLAEMVVQALAEQARSQGLEIRMSMVRFGNVLGSSGSVVPLFRRQIERGGPITLTDKRVTRYFMSIPEAAQLVIQAGAMADGGDVFVLDMGEPVKIYDLARSMIELSGLKLKDESNPLGDISIEVTGLRPGEKLYEELLIGESPQITQHPQIKKAREEFIPWEELKLFVNELMRAADVNDVLKMRTLIQYYVPAYQAAGIVDLVWTELNG